MEERRVLAEEYWQWIAEVLGKKNMARCYFADNSSHMDWPGTGLRSPEFLQPEPLQVQWRFIYSYFQWYTTLFQSALFRHVHKVTWHYPSLDRSLLAVGIILNRQPEVQQTKLECRILITSWKTSLCMKHWRFQLQLITI
jgi:hypothetical protein